jgi:hypothetical protein
MGVSSEITPIGATKIIKKAKKVRKTAAATPTPNADGSLPMETISLTDKDVKKAPKTSRVPPQKAGWFSWMWTKKSVEADDKPLLVDGEANDDEDEEVCLFVCCLLI